jgi:hypothetical protein
MSISNKTFKNNRTGETIRVIDSFEDIAVLENKGKEKVSNLMNPDLYTEQIDVSNFFNTQGAYNVLAEKIKNIPVDQIKDEPGSEIIVNVDGNNQFKPQINESAIIQVSEEDERAELARKYGMANPQNDVEKQNQAFARLLNPEEPVQKIEINRDEVAVNGQQMINVSREVISRVEDPIITMFKNVKRTKDFSISLEIKNKIPRHDFIEMMEDSYNTSIIDFLASEFTDNILRNPQMIEDMIRQKIKEVVYGAEVGVKDVNSQITDAVTQTKHEALSIEKEVVLSKDLPKKTPTRKPRPNTAQGEKGFTTKKSKKESTNND